VASTNRSRGHPFGGNSIVTDAHASVLVVLSDEPLSSEQLNTGETPN